MRLAWAGVRALVRPFQPAAAPKDEQMEGRKPMSDLQASSLALRAAGSYGNKPEPIPFLHILAVNDREDVRGEHGPLT
jgi:hypothetical protein